MTHRNRLSNQKPFFSKEYWIQQQALPSLEIYQQLYDIFAGDRNFLFSKKKRIFIPPRWGGITEIYAFVKIFNVNVNQWTYQKWDEKNNKIKLTTHKDNKRRLYLLQKIELTNDENENKLTLNLLYLDSFKEYKRHYMYLRVK